jgi:hypothetical protein
MCEKFISPSLGEKGGSFMLAFLNMRNIGVQSCVKGGLLVFPGVDLGCIDIRHLDIPHYQFLFKFDYNGKEIKVRSPQNEDFHGSPLRFQES